jgi:ATP-dependent DNA ligase
MRTAAFLPCLPTSGTSVPATQAWLHEIKYDGYRLIVQREGERVRLFSRNGNDWSGRYPWVVEAALKNKHSQFVIDGDARGARRRSHRGLQRPAFAAAEQTAADLVPCRGTAPISSG